MSTVEVKHCADGDGVNNGQNHSMDDGPIFFHYSDDNKKIAFNNSGDSGHWLKMLSVNKP